MICKDSAEYVSALCDRETIPSKAAQHIAHCPDCQARLSDYLALGVELRRAASLELSVAVPSVSWTKPQNRIATWWQKGWETMRIPRLAFVVLIAGILALASALAVNKARAHNTGSVVLLSTTGPIGPIMDCPLSTEDKNFAMCSSYTKVGSQFLAYTVNLTSRKDGRVLLAIRTHTYPVPPEGNVFDVFQLNAEPAREIWFEPGEPLRIDVPQIGPITLKGEWMDHMPVLGLHKEDLTPGPNEVRFASPLLLRDRSLVGDLKGSISGILATNDRDSAIQTYFPGEGRFLISLLPMKDAVEAKVTFSRISFEQGGHSWEFVTGAPVSRADKLWVLHQPDFRVPGINSPSVGNIKLVQEHPGVWVPDDTSN